MGTARIGRRTDGEVAPIRELVPLASMGDLVFGAWDIVAENACQVAVRSDVLPIAQLEPIRPLLEGIVPHQDIREFMTGLRAARAVMVTCASTETWRLRQKRAFAKIS